MSTKRVRWHGWIEIFSKPDSTAFSNRFENISRRLWKAIKSHASSWHIGLISHQTLKWQIIKAGLKTCRACLKIYCSLLDIISKPVQSNFVAKSHYANMLHPMVTLLSVEQWANFVAEVLSIFAQQTWSVRRPNHITLWVPSIPYQFLLFSRLCSCVKKRDQTLPPK